MTTKSKNLIATKYTLEVIAGFYFSTLLSIAQPSPTSIVNQYGELMTEWCKSDDEMDRQKIEELTSGSSGGISCRVDDGLKPLLAQKFEDVNPAISLLMDTYLNKISLCIEEDGLNYKFETPIWQKDYKEPVAFESKTDLPLQFVSMNFSTSGGLNYNGTSLFFVRGNQITNIVDFKEKKSIAEAIRLYSSRKYDEAFSIFRSLSYEDPSNFAAQYYTAVMEIKKQGCSNLNSKVRDLEACWWMIRGFYLYSNAQKKSITIDDFIERLYNLCYKFQPDEEALPYFKNSSYRNFLFTIPLCKEGMVPFRNKSKYGYMDEKGKIVIVPKFNMVFPFCNNGLAKVYMGEKKGFIDKKGEFVIQPIYDATMNNFYNNKTFVLLKNDLLLIDTKGNLVKNVGTGFDSISQFFVNGKAYVHNSNSDLWYVYDSDGEISSIEKTTYYEDYYSGIHYYIDSEGKRHDTPFDWK